MQFHENIATTDWRFKPIITDLREICMNQVTSRATGHQLSFLLGHLLQLHKQIVLNSGDYFTTF